MTYAQKLTTLKIHSDKCKSIAMHFEEKMSTGFSETSDLMNFLILDNRYQNAINVYHDYFAFCIRNDLNLDDEVKLNYLF